MTYAPKIILHAPPWDSPLLKVFVENCLGDAVGLVCVMGEDCERVHDVIDELVVGDASDASRFLLTSFHPNESLADVRAFAEVCTVGFEPGASIQEVTLVA